MASKDTGPATAEPGAGTPPASFAAAIEAEYAHRVRHDAGVQSYKGVPAFGPGDRVPSSHPAFGDMLEAGALEPLDG
jgi:hypothetical protein